MKNLIGKITAELAEKDNVIPEELIQKINANIRPPEPVTAETVYVRAMYIVSDQVNSYGGRFPVDEHQNMIAHLIDSPVLIGHRKDTLPIARNFHAEQVVRNDANWIKVYFFWLKNSEVGEELKNNIDAGIYKECSISFIFSFPECGICGSDIRDCRHQPFHEYETDSGEKQKAYFNYRKIERVLETSLVYRGSVSDTSITKELVFEKSDLQSEAGVTSPIPPSIKRIWDLDALDSDKEYLVAPAYESLRVLFEKSGDSVSMKRCDNTPIRQDRIVNMLSSIQLPTGELKLDCRLIGYRGKERQKVSELEKSIEGEDSSVTRLELKVYDLIALNQNDYSNSNADVRRKKLEELFDDNREILPPAEKVLGANLYQALKKIGTRHGIEIFALDSSERFLFTKRKLIPAIIESVEDFGRQSKYRVTPIIDGESNSLTAIISSPAKLNIGDKIEIEVTSVHTDGDLLELLDPEVFDKYGDCGYYDIHSLATKDSAVEIAGKYTLFPSNHGAFQFELEYGSGHRSEYYSIRNFSLRLVDRGRLFLIERVDHSVRSAGSIRGTGKMVGHIILGESTVFSLEGILSGRFAITPARLNGKQVTVFRKIIKKLE